MSRVGLMKMMGKAHSFLKRSRAISRGVHALGYGRRSCGGRSCGGMRMVRRRRRGGALSPAGGALNPVGAMRVRSFMSSRRGLRNLPMNY
jgi:hypothetical protein